MLSNISSPRLSRTSSISSITNETSHTSKAVDNTLQISISYNNVSTVSLYVPIAHNAKVELLKPIDCSEKSLKATFLNSKHDPKYPGFKQKDTLQGLFSSEPGSIPQLKITRFSMEFRANDLAKGSPAGEYYLARVQFTVSRPKTSLPTRMSRFFKPSAQPRTRNKQDERPLLTSAKEKETQRYLVGLYFPGSKYFITISEKQLHTPSTKIAGAINALLLDETLFSTFLAEEKTISIPTRHEQPYRTQAPLPEEMLLLADNFNRS